MKCENGNEFTHALLDFEGSIIKKYRWTDKDYKWYISTYPDNTIIKLDKPPFKSEYQRSLEIVGECLF